jgi:hypothetical protein
MRAFRLTVALAACSLAASLAANDSITWNGFALLRPQSSVTGMPLGEDSLSAQVQAGIDWRPTVALGAHVHVLARNNDDDSRRGRAGVVEAFLEQNFSVGTDRIRLMEGAFFLPTSRENIDSLWASPYTITPSALNTWMGEEFRPIGVDASYTHRLPGAAALTGGATVFRGNDTFGALPVVRGWDFSDRWTLLGEHAVVNARFFTSVSAETDGRLGWSARGKWNNRHATVQVTRIDNRADALRYGELFNWATRYNIVGADYTWNEWTAVSEIGWGTSAIQGRVRASSDIQSSYILLSRRISNARASVRVDRYGTAGDDEHAVTAALFWEPRGRLRTGIEGIATNDQKRLAVEVRYSF